MNKTINAKTNHYLAIDWIKYFAAMLIICVHCDKFFQEPLYNFLLKSVICRLAVPFFFIAAGFFVRKGMTKSPDYLRRYISSLVKSYLWWSLLFLPIGLEWVTQNINLPVYLYPVAFVVGLIYVGTYYHLWYIPAIIFALIAANWLLKKMSYPKAFILTALLYSFGCLESYSGLLADTILGAVFTQYQQLFITTRNGLFYGLIFVMIGYFIHDYSEKLKILQHYAGSLTLIFSYFYFLEGMLLFFNRGSDMNFTITLIPLSFFIFLWSLKIKLKSSFGMKKMREFSKYYYYLHPMFLVLFTKLTLWFYGADFLASGWVQFIIVLGLTHFFSWLLIVGQKYYKGFRPQKVLETEPSEKFLFIFNRRVSNH